MTALERTDHAHHYRRRGVDDAVPELPVRARDQSVQVYGTALATIVLVVCAFGYMAAKGVSPQNASRWMGGMFAAVFAAIVCVGAPSIVTIVQGWAATAA